MIVVFSWSAKLHWPNSYFQIPKLAKLSSPLLFTDNGATLQGSGQLSLSLSTILTVSPVHLAPHTGQLSRLYNFRSVHSSHLHYLHNLYSIHLIRLILSTSRLMAQYNTTLNGSWMFHGKKCGKVRGKNLTSLVMSCNIQSNHFTKR